MLPNYLNRQNSTIYWLALALILAVSLRYGYQEGMLHQGGNFHNGSDSGKYLAIANTIVETGIFGHISENGVQPELNRMPIYPYFLAGIFKIFGQGNLLAVVRVQILVDIFTILGLAVAVSAINKKLVVPSVFMAAVIPNFLVHTSYVLTETLFLFFFVWGLSATLWAIRGYKTGWTLIAAGILFSLSLYTRPVMLVFPFFMFPFLAYAFKLQRENTTARAILLSTIPFLIILVSALPRISYNYVEYGHAVFTSQSGGHLLKWVYPCLRSPWSCSSHGIAWQENAPIIERRISELTDMERTNPLAKNVQMGRLGLEKILDLGFTQIFVGMAVGAIKNTIQTAVYETLTQFKQPTTFFSSMPGNTFSQRIHNFASQNRNHYFMGFWVIAQIALFGSRLIQLSGLWRGISDRNMRPYCVFLAATIGYFLLINGPIANPKYRVPMEPALIIFLAIGAQELRSKFHIYLKRMKNNDTYDQT